MEIMEALRTRRSIRKYTDKAISDTDIKTMLACAMLAPSARNEQPWQFVVAREAQTRQRLAATSPYTGMAAHAPLVIVVLGDMREEKAAGMWVQDCAAATENLLLAARGLGIGGVWCGVHPEADREERVRAALSLPAEVVPFALVCLGFPAQEFKPADRFLPERVHYERW